MVPAHLFETLGFGNAYQGTSEGYVQTTLWYPDELPLEQPDAQTQEPLALQPPDAEQPD